MIILLSCFLLLLYTMGGFLMYALIQGDENIIPKIIFWPLYAILIALIVIIG